MTDNDSSENIYRSPESNLDADDKSIDGFSGFDLATRWDRLWAYLIDTIILMPILLAILFFTGYLGLISENEQFSLVHELLIALLAVGIFALINGQFLLSSGQTVGKKVLKIRIVTLSDEHAPIKVLLARYGFYWLLAYIPFVGQLLNMINVLFIFSSEKRCGHDHVAGTKVISLK